MVKRSDKIVGIWLLVGTAMIIVQIVLGGITRLTGSGLSITEWKPLLGTIPPLTDADWQNAFEKYQEIAQFKQLNSHFNLGDFKFIYFWEWLHRLWARILGFAFLIPFVYFAMKGYFNSELRKMLIVLFLLGALQGLLGWIMVKSGLNDTDLYVNHIRLAIHFMAALVLLVFTFWYALKLLIQEGEHVSPGLKRLNFLLIVALTIQLTYGAFMAGMKAGVYAPTWPDINGHFLALEGNNPSALRWINDPISLHFVHRNLAYLLTFMIGVWTYIYFKANNSIKRFRFYMALPLWLVIIQVILGILAVLTSYHAIPQGWGRFEWAAELHQLVAIFLLMSLVANHYLMRSEKKGAILR